MAKINNEEMDEIFAKVRELDILDIVENYSKTYAKVDIELTPTSTDVYTGYSPFRTDSSKGSFTVSTQKNIFKDWVMTDHSGDLIKFVSLIAGISYFEAAVDIALRYGIITTEKYQQITNKKAPKELKLYERKQTVRKKVVREIADEKTLNRVFELFISCCKLSDKHLEILQNDRKLTLKEIKDLKLFSFPSRAVMRKFIALLEVEFGGQDILAKIPGFFKRVGEKNFTFSKLSGIGIPITNENGNIVGIQIRRDEISEGENRYTWFSSAFAVDDPKGQYELGTSSGSPVAVIYPENIKYKAVFITEGFWKAVEISKQFNCIAISVQGVSTWRPIKDIIQRLPEVVTSVDFDVKAIYPAFDADMCHNINVYLQLKKMTDNLLDLSDRIEYISWDINLGKGIDDMLEAGHKDKLMNISKASYDAKYQKLIEKIIEEREDITSMSQICTKMTCEEFGEYFNKYFDLGDFIKR